MDQVLEDLTDTLRDICPTKNRGASKNKVNKTTPCWRTNKGLESKALEKAFTRHKKKSDNEKCEFVNDIIINYRESYRYRETVQKAGEFLSQPRMLAVWLNQDGWLDEFETAPSEMKAKIVDRTCRCCGNEGTIGGAGDSWICEKEYRRTDPQIALLREITKRNLQEVPKKPGESWKDWSFRVMDVKGLTKIARSFGIRK